MWFPNLTTTTLIQLILAANKFIRSGLLTDYKSRGNRYYISKIECKVSFHTRLHSAKTMILKPSFLLYSPTNNLKFLIRNQQGKFHLRPVAACIGCSDFSMTPQCCVQSHKDEYTIELFVCLFVWVLSVSSLEKNKPCWRIRLHFLTQACALDGGWQLLYY